MSNVKNGEINDILSNASRILREERDACRVLNEPFDATKLPELESTLDAINANPEWREYILEALPTIDAINDNPDWSTIKNDARLYFGKPPEEQQATIAAAA